MGAARPCAWRTSHRPTKWVSSALVVLEVRQKHPPYSRDQAAVRAEAAKWERTYWWDQGQARQGECKRPLVSPPGRVNMSLCRHRRRVVDNHSTRRNSRYGEHHRPQQRVPQGDRRGDALAVGPRVSVSAPSPGPPPGSPAVPVCGAARGCWLSGCHHPRENPSLPGWLPAHPSGAHPRPGRLGTRRQLRRAKWPGHSGVSFREVAAQGGHSCAWAGALRRMAPSVRPWLARRSWTRPFEASSRARSPQSSPRSTQLQTSCVYVEKMARPVGCRSLAELTLTADPPGRGKNPRRPATDAQATEASPALGGGAGPSSSSFPSSQSTSGRQRDARVRGSYQVRPWRPSLLCRAPKAEWL